MNFSPRSEVDKISTLIHYHRMYKKKETWSQTLNHRLPHTIPASKDIVVGIYKAILSIHERKLKKSARNPLPTSDELLLKKYGSKKQVLPRTTLNKYLKYMVEGMIQIIAIDHLTENKSLALPAYLGGLKDNPEFHLSEMLRNHKHIERNMFGYAILKDTYFHPLYNKRMPAATELMGRTIEEFKITSYTETIILALQSMELNLAKGNRLPSFPHLHSMIGDARTSDFWNDVRLETYVSCITAIEDGEHQIERTIRFAEAFPKTVKLTDGKGKPLLPDYDASYIYNILSNTLIRHQRNGNEQCRIIASELNDACIDTAAIMVDGFIPHEYFFNIMYQRTEVGFTQKLHTLDDMLSFITDHTELVHENKRETSSILTRKYAYLRYGEAEKAFQIGIGKSYSIVDEMLFACFELACLFCLDLKDDGFNTHCKAFQTLLEEGRSDNNKVQIDGYLAFVQELQELRKLDEKNKKLHKLDKPSMLPLYQSKYDEIKTNPNYISMKPWLLDMYTQRIS